MTKPYTKIMRIGIIGPAHVDKFCKLLGFKKEEYLDKVCDIAEHIANTGHEIMIVPHKKSVSEQFARAYQRNDGKKTIGIFPLDDIERGFDFLNQELVDEHINSGTWRNLTETIDENSDILLCFGLTPGTVTEICQTKWYKVKKIYIIEDFISRKLPEEINAKLRIEYIAYDEIAKKIR